MEKIKVELTPYEALNICAALEWVRETCSNAPSVSGISAAELTFRRQVLDRISESQIDDAFAQRAVEKLVGRD